MKESSTYQAILEEGRGEGAVAEAKKLLRIFGDARFGVSDNRTAAVIERTQDLTLLENLCARVQNATTWQELVGQPATARRSKRRPSP